LTFKGIVKLSVTVAVGFAVLALGSAYAGTATYSNYTGTSDTTEAWNISNYAVTDSFTVAPNSTATLVTFDAWVQYSADTVDTLSSVDWSINTSNDTTGLGTTVDPSGLLVNSDFIDSSGDSWVIYQETFPINVFLAGGATTYWLELQNATSALSQTIWWDESNGASVAVGGGIGDLSGYCNQGLGGCSGSESLSVAYTYGTTGGSTPEPGTAALLGAGLVLAGVLRRRLAR
jgi:hypothetical protein